MKNVTLKSVMLGLATFVFATAANATLLGFDDGATVQTGKVTYDGIGGGLIATNITLDSIIGTDTPLNDGSALICKDCLMSFETGANLTEAATAWTWAPGGFLTIVGTVFDGLNQIASGTLVSGSFVGNSTANGDGAGTGIFTGFGVDSKNVDLLSFFGIDPTASFRFATTALTVGGCTQFGGSNGFACDIDNADMNNTQVVSSPAPFALMGLGLLGLASTRKRFSKS